MHQGLALIARVDQLTLLLVFLVVVEVALLDVAVLEADLAGQRQADAHHRRAFHLRYEAWRLGHDVLAAAAIVLTSEAMVMGVKAGLDPKVMQEVISLSVFVPFAVFYLKERLTLDYLWAGLCLLGAVYFMFRGKLA